MDLIIVKNYIKLLLTQCDYSYFLSSICMGIINTEFAIEI